MSKRAKPDHPVHELIASRWSPYGYDAEREVSDADLRSLFEAARWAPSSYNEQPWSYIVATRRDPPRSSSACSRAWSKPTSSGRGPRPSSPWA